MNLSISLCGSLTVCESRSVSVYVTVDDCLFVLLCDSLCECTVLRLSSFTVLTQSSVSTDNTTEGDVKDSEAIKHGL